MSFVLIFVAELGDKTLYAILLLAARHRALPVLLGAFAAFVVQGVIAVGLGVALSRLSGELVRWVTVAVFFGFGLALLAKREARVGDEDRPRLPRFGKVVLTSFIFVFLAEWGDASQIGTAALVAHLRAPVQVFVGATLGLWLGTLLAVAVGRSVGARLPAVRGAHRAQVWLRRRRGDVRNQHARGSRPGAGNFACRAP